ncbi:PAS domain-containing hybrid sensor histidine kinase/response regulator [Methylobacterium sp. WL9]|uniref:hybrid sensor histidine kinase/response regulator n=1 Tax=Methylobacterium sp. WL9 TaxID=2603898 RepID=UPI0011CC7346|nr:PAS domain-containing hybrid sensor histidine kinase/response regulator [Methylobacterium sp. WL9]TXN21131.1 PAS domain S-box protein [Methylobacterium sp. WL9]
MDEVTPILRAQEADDLEDLFENAPCGYASTLPNGRLSRVNRTLATWTGYTAEQLVGRRFLDLLNIAGKIYYETHFAPLLRMQGFFNEVALDIVRADGAALPVLVNAVARRDDAGELRFIRITVFNASDRRRYERDLLEARRTADEARVALQDLNATLEAQVAKRTAQRDRAWRLSQELLVVALPDGTFESVNPTWTELLGWWEDELIGASFVERTHPDDLTATLAVFDGILERPLTIPHASRFRHKGGSYRWFAWTAAFEDGRVYASGRDITLEREQAEALRQSQKMEAVGQLTGGLAHDFNNLLAGISGSLEMMQNRMQQGRFNDVERYMSVAQGASKRAAALTHRLLAFSRRQILDPKPTDVNRLVAGMQEMVQRTVGPGISVEVVGASGLWAALVDPPQLENALLNLCINARDAMPDGGRITVETANKWLDESSSRKLGMPEGQYLSLCVTDTGIGMSKDVIARVFEPFFTTKPIGEGTGLGLSMIYGFAQQSGGQVRIYSEVGEGSTVCIYLPRHYGEVAFDDPIAKLTVLPRSEQGETVLVVDDEPSVRMLVTDILDDLGYTSIEAGDSAAGLKVLLSDVRIDLLVTDVGLPGGMNGRQMADAARVSRPDLKVLFVTGYAENALLSNGHLVPGMAVLTKPFPIEIMAARIRSMIEAKR